MKCTRVALNTVALGALLLGGCSEAELPQRSLQRDDCLREVRLDQLPQALGRCDKVVAAFPSDPGPRNERSLLLALSGDDPAACRDIAAAQQLARQAKPGSLDPLLVSELAVRQRSCQRQR
ncbi:MAG: hypothetical protein VKM98_09495 [Cyanobacteriota bacterium]|nr:hypothetical protein [Cyanobacteriota bacterium]